MEHTDSMVLSTAYLGNVQYFSKFLFGNVLIEQHDSYTKQTYRNRCRILTGNGVENLSIPVIKPNGNATLVKDVMLDMSRNWQQQHWRAITAAYNNSPFFEFYADDFYQFYSHTYKFLIDYNNLLTDLILSNIGVVGNYSLTGTFNNKYQNDFREVIHPKKPFKDTFFIAVPYYQVFQEKFGFEPNLSIIDLLFNCGPETILILKKCSGT